MIQVINDDALFRKRDIPGDQDEFEDRSMMDEGQIKHDLYSAINDLIRVYDMLDNPEYIAQSAGQIRKVKEMSESLLKTIK